MKQLMPGIVMVLLLCGCTHKVEVAAKEPITVNLNLKIEHDIRIKVDKELDEVFEQDDTLF